MSRRSTARRGGRVAATVAGAGGLVALLLVAGIRLGMDPVTTVPAGNTQAQTGSTEVPAVAVTRTSGTSAVKSDQPPNPVNLRVCPNTNDQANCWVDTTYPRVADQLKDGAEVQMWCWEDTSKPANDNTTGSPRWFYVTEVTGPHRGLEGYVYSAEIPVANQIITPHCTDQIIAAHEPISPPKPSLQFRVVGSCTTAGGTLTAVSANFTPGAEFLVQATGPDGNDYPLDSDRGIVNPDGTVPWNWPCAGAPAGTYSTTLVDTSDGQQIGPVYFSIAPAPATSPPTVSTTPPQAPPATPTSAASTPAPAQTTPAAAPPSPTTYAEQEWHTGANTFTDPHNASGMGIKIAPGQWVQVTCKLYDPTIVSSNPDGYWYKIASSPWNNQYWACANTFLNGDPWGGPYTHPTDLSVPDC